MTWSQGRLPGRSNRQALEEEEMGPDLPDTRPGGAQVCKRAHVMVPSLFHILYSTELLERTVSFRSSARGLDQARKELRFAVGVGGLFHFWVAAAGRAADPLVLVEGWSMTVLGNQVSWRG